MECPTNQNDTADLQVSLSGDKLDEAITKWRNTAFTVALNKLIESKGNLEIVMQTGEAFGRGLFSQLIVEKPHNWIMYHWIDHITTRILHRLGQDVNIQDLTDAQATLSIQKCSLCDHFAEPHVATLFIYSTIRGLHKSSYPKGEVILKNTMVHGSPITELILKANAIPQDQHSREHAKQIFTTTQKL